MLRVIIGLVLLALLVMLIRGYRQYSRARDKVEALDEARFDSESLEIDEEIAREKRYQRAKTADINDINSDD